MEELPLPSRMEFVSYPRLGVLLLLPVSRVRARVDGSKTLSFKFEIAISDSG